MAVAADSNASGGSSGTTLAGEAVQRAPAALRQNALRAAIATTPGWTSEDNGLVHYRGVDDGLLLVVDGVPVYERLDAVSGVSPDLNGVGSINVVTGYVPPEFGYKAGGVIEVRSAVPQSWTGHAEAGVGSDDGRDM